tara:strand:- start:2 stop:289 length:288 start_codon:yes stop_codon:yes gene_type:complete
VIDTAKGKLLPKKNSNVDSKRKFLSSLPTAISDKVLSIENKTQKEAAQESTQKESIPSGSSVLRIKSIRGKIIEKTYLTPAGKKNPYRRMTYEPI